MSISTKTGDRGETGLWTGERIGKDDLRVEAYGCLDELSSFLGMARHACGLGPTREAIESIQRDLLRACAELASPGAERVRSLGAADEEALTAAVLALEDRIDRKCSYRMAIILPAGQWRNGCSP